ncbi:MAG: RsmE family RNA methyltransferase [Chloroflexota bacterium]|nr:RsmE family RNA methyltransferase [Chloroflexota bacterium]
MHRFFIPAQWIEGNAVVIEGAQVHQLRDVLRLSAGDRIVVLDNSGVEREVELQAVERGRASGVVRGSRTAAEPRTSITLYQTLLKGSRFEFVIQKCTELGVAGFVPVLSERCVPRDAGAATERRLERWRRIIVEAAEQSKRGRLPTLSGVMSFEQACQSATGLSLLPWEEERALGLRVVVQRELAPGENPVVSLFVGPEGGFTASEVAFARGCGVVPVSLGSRVLRAETAGLVAASAVFYETGDLDPVVPD